MRNSPREPDQGGPDRPAADGSPLLGIDAVAGRLHQDYADLLRLTVEAQRWGGTPGAAGCTVGDYLTWEAGLPRWLAGQLESVARRLAVVPRVAELFWAGVVTFDQLAGFVRATSWCNGQLLARLDAECASLAEALAESGRIHAWCHEVELLVEDLRAPGWRDRAERRLERGQRVSVQQDLDGGGLIVEELDPVGFATRMAALDAATDPDGVARDGVQRARADATVRIARAFLAGDPAEGRPAGPTVVWHVDVADATVDRFAQQLHATGVGEAMIPVSARLLATLADNADHVIALQDGRRPLDELAVDADDIPAKVRRAVHRRDRGCRFPDCGRPRIHLHHLQPRSAGGSHAPGNLVGLCAFHHLRYVHRLGWQATLDEASGRVTWTNSRTGTQIGTMPVGARPPPVRDPAVLPDWAAPPRSPPPDRAQPPEPPAVPDSWTPPPPGLHTTP